MSRNVILFLNSFWNNQNGLSGGDQIVIQVYKRLRKEINQFICFTNADGKKVLTSEISDILIFTSHRSWDRFHLLINYFLRTICALRCLSIKNIQLIHSSSDFLPDVLPGWLYKMFNPHCKWIVNVMHIYPHWQQRPGNKLMNFIAQYMQQLSFLLIKKSAVVITLNQQVKKHLLKLGFKRNLIKIIPAGIDYQYFENLKVKKETEYYDATFLARLKPSKGIFDLLEIWQLVVKKIPTARLAIIGGGGTKAIVESLKKKIKHKQLMSNVQLLGYLDNNQSFALIKKSKVFVFPSHEEGFGIAIAEAMACGTPVIAWDLKVYDEVFGNQLIKIPKDDIVKMSKAIVCLLNNDQKRIRLSKSARDYIKAFSWANVAQAYSEIMT